MSHSRLCIFGEVLFDHFPDGRRVLGGAPFNVAWHLQAFGAAPHFISRVGDDPEGRAVRDAMRAWGMDLSGLQTDDRLPTGRVDIRFDDGEPAYDIVRPCAYDAIEAPGDDSDCRLLYHGSLALREAPSARALARIRRPRCGMVFIDVNLRPPWWRREQVAEMLHSADWVKLNAAELVQLHPAGRAGEGAAADFMQVHGLQGLIVTHGADGAEVLTAGGQRFSAPPVHSPAVVDTVGAGDAFASVMILGLVGDWPLPLALARAQAFASALVGRRGATVSDPDFYRSFLRQWQLSA